MRWISIVGIMLCLMSSVAAESIVENAREDFLNEWKPSDDSKLLSLEVDLNNDGEKELLLSLPNLTNGKQGNLWTLYIPIGRSLGNEFKKQYRKVEATAAGLPIEFHLEAATRRAAEGDLLTYAPGGAGRGQLMTYQLRGQALSDTILREIAPQAEDREEFLDLFHSEKKDLPVEKKTVSEVRLQIAESKRTPFWHYIARAVGAIIRIVLLFDFIFSRLGR